VNTAGKTEMAVLKDRLELFKRQGKEQNQKQNPRVQELKGEAEAAMVENQELSGELEGSKTALEAANAELEGLKAELGQVTAASDEALAHAKE
jgi:hypothetical protein